MLSSRSSRRVSIWDPATSLSALSLASCAAIVSFAKLSLISRALVMRFCISICSRRSSVVSSSAVASSRVSWVDFVLRLISFKKSKDSLWTFSISLPSGGTTTRLTTKRAMRRVGTTCAATMQKSRASCGEATTGSLFSGTSPMRDARRRAAQLSRPPSRTRTSSASGALNSVYATKAASKCDTASASFPATRCATPNPCWATARSRR